jgi:hypothetical protein
MKPISLLVQRIVHPIPLVTFVKKFSTVCQRQRQRQRQQPKSVIEGKLVVWQDSSVRVGVDKDHASLDQKGKKMNLFVGLRKAIREISSSWFEHRIDICRNRRNAYCSIVLVVKCYC